MKSLTIQSLEILEWYDAPLIALVNADTSPYYFNCVRYDFSERTREYVVFQINAYEASSLQRIFQSGEPALELEVLCREFNGRDIYLSDEELDVGVVVHLEKTRVSFDEISTFLRFPVIDQLTAE